MNVEAWLWECGASNLTRYTSCICIHTGHIQLGKLIFHRLVSLQRVVYFLNALLCDDQHLQAVTNLNMPLGRTGKCVPH